MNTERDSDRERGVQRRGRDRDSELCTERDSNRERGVQGRGRDTDSERQQSGDRGYS